MAKPNKYLVVVRTGEPVGPHKVDSLREWVELGIISADLLACRDGETAWVRIADIPGFYVMPLKLRERLNHHKVREIERWWNDEVTDKQLAKLQFFEIPFSKTGLTKGRASELIEAFINIDPKREKRYQNQAASPDQIRQIRSLGGQAKNLTHSEAKDVIDKLELERESAEQILDNLDLKLNHEDVREIYRYKHLSKSQLKRLLAYFSANVPDWQNKSGYDLGRVVLELYPDHVRAARRQTVSYPRQTDSGCLVLVLALFSISLLLLVAISAGIVY